GVEIEVVIKTFCVPADIVGDPERITREREKFLASARLQKQLTEAGAKAWVEILRISEDPENTSFSMKKTGASLQDLIDRRVNLTADDLYQVTLAIVQGFDELWQKHKRSHGSLKPSDVLSVPGQQPPYRMSDPAPKGEDHSANDLYALGQIIFQLIEHKEWDPLVPIIPTSKWARFKGKRDKWISFLQMLLAPNGCQESLASVRTIAQRLKPASPARNLVLAGGCLTVLLGVAVAAGVGVWYFWPQLHKSSTTTGPVVITTAPGINADIKSTWEKSHQAYLDTLEKWRNRTRTARYDHTRSSELAQTANQSVLEIQLTDNDAYQRSTEGYGKAASKLQEALAQYAAEDKVGQQQDADALADLQKAQGEFAEARAAWESTVAKFNPGHNHANSTAMVQATLVPSPATAPADAAGRKSLADQFRTAASRFTQAVALAKQEELAGLSIEQAKSTYQDARNHYQQAKDKWDAQSVGITFDFSAARKLADEARAGLPDQLELSDPASYQKARDLYADAATRMDAAVAALEKAKADFHAAEADSGTAVARARDAYEKRDYSNALAWYRKAADLKNPEAQFWVGYLYETGRGTERNTTEAARWYQSAADQKNTPAMINLGLLYERGLGVTKDYKKAIDLYKQAADLKDATGMRNMAYLYEGGFGVEKDLAEAMRWYQKGAAQNDPSSLYCIGLFYEQGKGVPVDYQQAIAWYVKAADLKYARAMNSLGVLYETGRGVKQDLAAALDWYKKAAALNFAPAMSNIGALYDNGIGVPLDHAQAFGWFKRGAELGHPMSMYNLAVLYETGRGTGQDLGQALDWYRKAAASDDDLAKKQAADRLKVLGFPVN
ncbi:MAG TPA: hypothetical protein VHM90_14995, partial [Phycisphaerae bacterium]|nr:hypothetical protein [Phycisphaerae bacterium]